jgi:PiT family inorganic phosphate transporter
MSLWLAVSFALAFSFTNGFHDAANAIATLVATRGATPGQAVVLSGVFKMLGAVVVGTAVADTIAGIVTVSGADAVAAIGSGALAAVVWNLLTWWRALPSSSAHALVGGLVGAALAASGAVKWGGLDGWKPTGVLGVLIALALSPCVGFLAGAVLIRLDRRLLRRASREVGGPVRIGEWAMSSALSFGQGANDAQKAMGVIAALLLAAGRVETLTGRATGLARSRSGIACARSR